jgi:hypothetical protein
MQAIMQQLSNIASAASYDLKPALRDGAQVTPLGHPAIHRTIPSD